VTFYDIDHLFRRNNNRPAFFYLFIDFFYGFLNFEFFHISIL